MKSTKLFWNLEYSGQIFGERHWNGVTHWIYFPKGCQKFRTTEIGVIIEKNYVNYWAWPDKPNGEQSNIVPDIKSLCELLNSRNIKYKIYKLPKGVKYGWVQNNKKTKK